MKKKSNITIFRSPEFYKYHVINSDDVLEHGMKKACILGNLDKYFHLTKDELHEGFPYFTKEEFYILLEELMQDGLVIVEGN